MFECCMYHCRSRSPIAAIQLMFECCVYLLGNTDVSLRTVRQVTNDDGFCTALTAVQVTELAEETLAFLNHRLDVSVQLFLQLNN